MAAILPARSPASSRAVKYTSSVAKVVQKKFQMQAATQTPVDIVTVIQSLIVLFIAAPPLVRTIFRLRGQRSGAEATTIKVVGA